MELFANRVFNIDTENAFKIGPHISSLESQGKKIIKLNLGEPDFNIPDCMKEEIKRQIDLNNTHYCDPKGILSLREAIAKQIQSTRGITVSPERVVVFPGAKPGIGFSQQIYCNPGDEIIYPSPGFPIYESFIKYLGCIPKPIHLKEETGFTFTPEQLEQVLSSKTKLIFLNFPSNPTGGVASLKQLKAISELILKKCSSEVRIYSDEIYENIIFDGEKHHSIATLPGMEERTIISSGFSKTYAWTGGRVGYAVLPSIKEAEAFKNLNINYFSCVPPYNQEAARVGLEHKDVLNEIQKMVDIFQTRRDVIVKALHEIKGVRCQIPKGAFYVFPNVEIACEELGAMDAFNALPKEIQAKTSPSTLFQMFALFHHNVACLDRRSFGKIGSEKEHFIRLSAAADIETLKQGVQNLNDAFQDKPGFKKYIQQKTNVY
jgi:aspartate aminotransferase